MFLHKHQPQSQAWLVVVPLVWILATFSSPWRNAVEGFSTSDYTTLINGSEIETGESYGGSSRESAPTPGIGGMEEKKDGKVGDELDDFLKKEEELENKLDEIHLDKIEFNFTRTSTPTQSPTFPPTKSPLGFDDLVDLLNNETNITVRDENSTDTPDPYEGREKFRAPDDVRRDLTCWKTAYVRETEAPRLEEIETEQYQEGAVDIGSEGASGDGDSDDVNSGSLPDGPQPWSGREGDGGTQQTELESPLDGSETDPGSETPEGGTEPSSPYIVGGFESLLPVDEDGNTPGDASTQQMAGVGDPANSVGLALADEDDDDDVDDEAEEDEGHMRMRCRQHLSIVGRVPTTGTLLPPSENDLQQYNYYMLSGQSHAITIEGSVSLRNMKGEKYAPFGLNASSDQIPQVMVQVRACGIGTVPSCTPYVGEEEARKSNGTDDYLPYVDGDAVMIPINATRKGEVFSFNTTVSLTIDVPYVFYLIAYMRFYAKSYDRKTGETTYYAYDIANPLDERLVFFEEPATILEVEEEVILGNTVISGLSCAFMAYMAYQTFLHRNSKVMKLSQGSVLIALLFLGMVTSGATFLLDARSDKYCRFEPVVWLSLHIMNVIVLGRLWRINTVMSPLLRSRCRRSDWFILKFLDEFCVTFYSILTFIAYIGVRKKKGVSVQLQSGNVRGTVTTFQLTRVIIVLSLPPLALVILKDHLDRSVRELELKDDRTEGRYVCSDAPGVGLYDATRFLLVALLLLNVLLSYHSRHFPALFNETECIWTTTLVTGLLGIFSTIILVLLQPTSAPAVEFVVKVASVLAASLCLTSQLVMPKLRRVWSGEQIVVSTLVNNYQTQLNGDTSAPGKVLDGPSFFSSGFSTESFERARAVRGREVGEPSETASGRGGAAPGPDNKAANKRKSLLNSDDGSASVAVPRAVATTGQNPGSLLNSEDGSAFGFRRIRAESAMVEFPPEVSAEDLDNVAMVGIKSDMGGRASHFSHLDRLRSLEENSRCRQSASSQLPSTDESVNTNTGDAQDGEGSISSANQEDSVGEVPPTQLQHHTSQGSHQRQFVIRRGKSPPRGLLLRMMDANEELTRINGLVTEGVALTECDWEKLRHVCTALGTDLNEKVAFEWAQKNQ